VSHHLRRWRVKDTVFSSWRELPDLHTSAEIWKMRREGRFEAAEVLEESQQYEGDDGEESGPA